MATDLAQYEPQVATCDDGGEIRGGCFSGLTPAPPTPARSFLRLDPGTSLICGQQPDILRLVLPDSDRGVSKKGARRYVGKAYPLNLHHRPICCFAGSGTPPTSSQPTSFSVREGEYERSCPDHDAFTYCGTINGWAEQACKIQNSRELPKYRLIKRT
ncbi:hypothetical protein I6F21_26910 [Bradyrhizobium sp. NBAIM03]|uniref:hypothetical protein n=1 Tax=Bradyrhizobium sp. NBAIM03 TaxID=2793816 RepID=UPI001CD66EDF|nr:hypothetical protein [Bradyrhizobium sp. NBAIM03]MCA1536166.1 hypothetical protein [Bradyrhizobium sp. NBAIM03]